MISRLSAGHTLTTHVAEGEAIDLVDLPVPQLERDALNSGWLVVLWITHEREQAGPQRSDAKRTTSQKAQTIAGVCRQPGQIDMAGCIEIALGQGADDRHGLGPECECSRRLVFLALGAPWRYRTIPIADQCDRFLAREAFAAGQPIDAIAMRVEQSSDSGRRRPAATAGRRDGRGTRSCCRR